MDLPAGAQLLSIVERVERLHEDKKDLENDLRDVYAEAKGNGFDVKAIKDIVKRRRLDPDTLAEQDAILDTYLRALATAQHQVLVRDSHTLRVGRTAENAPAPA